jgi:hypothetical protein
MSATLHKLPERTFRPTNIDDAIRIIDMKPGDHGYLVALARFALNAIDASQETAAKCRSDAGRMPALH